MLELIVGASLLYVLFVVVKALLNPPSAASEEQDGKPIERPENDGIDQQAQAIVNTALELLAAQSMLMGSIRKPPSDDWSIGYVAGFVDALLQKAGKEPDVEGMVVMTLVFSNVFGHDEGPSLFGKFMRLQAAGSERALNGMRAGGMDVFRWVNEPRELGPMGWYSEIKGIAA